MYFGRHLFQIFYLSLSTGLTFRLKKVRVPIFITLKNPSSSAGFEPSKLGSHGNHATTKPPRTTKLNSVVKA
jgi:hypothetical protein